METPLTEQPFVSGSCHGGRREVVYTNETLRRLTPADRTRFAVFALDMQQNGPVLHRNPPFCECSIGPNVHGCNEKM